MKKTLSLLLSLLMVFSAASALAAKSKATPTPLPLEIGTELVSPPEQIQRLLDVAYNEWVNTNGKDQGVKNKYTTWYNNYDWGKNSWCAGFVTWCMLEAEIPQMPQDELMKTLEEGTSPEPIYHIKGSAPKKMAPGYLYMHRTSSIPQKGFVVLYGEKSNKYVHVGIVYDVELRPDGKYRLTCIEGAMKNTVRMFVYDYDPAAQREKNIVLLPKDERTEEETKIFTYGNHKSGTSWYVNCFLMPWVPGDDNL
ncbi:MAG: CHAP domain-containing protein [Clostridia bacterium]|nr:CHAP domain-containing protein [Clostridia bacterium]